MITNCEDILDRLNLKKCDSQDIADATYFKSWYTGYNQQFHSQSIFVSGKLQNYVLHQSGLGRQIASEWASLLKFTSSEIKMQNELQENVLKEYFLEKDIVFKFVKFFEVVTGQGYGLVLNIKDGFGNVSTRFLEPNQFNVVQVNGDGDITGVMLPFIDYLYVEVFDKEKQMYKTSIFLTRSIENGNIEYFEDASKITYFKYPNFTIFQNALSNKTSENLFSPSVFHNAIEDIKAFDKIYTDFLEEYNLGRKRMFVSKDLTEKDTFTTDAQGNPVTIEYFDTNDRLLQVTPNISLSDMKPIQDYSPELRINAYLQGVYFAVNMVTLNSKLGSNYFSLTADDGSINMTTATQVISNNSETFRHLKKFELNVENNIRKFIRSLMFHLGKGYIKLSDVSVQFDDSITKDDNVERNNAILEVQSGVRSVYSYNIEILNRNEAEAQEEVEKINNEKGVADTPQNQEDVADTQNQEVKNESIGNKGIANS